MRYRANVAGGTYFFAVNLVDRQSDLLIDGSGQTTYAYDGFGRLLTKVQTINGTARTTSYTYGSSGNTVGKLTSMTYPSSNRP